jgi:hypothetical protein
MTTDSTQPQMEVGPSPANGSGQSQGHRRRRRRRKNKGSQGPAAQVQQPQPQPQAQAPAPHQSPPPSQSRAPQNQGGGQGRKKKKFFQKASTPRSEPGNSVSYSPGNGSGGGQGKRKMRQRGPREFVGPMDHSYRELNGNVADGPPSTIQITSTGHNGYHQDPYFAPFASPVREDAPTKILCFIDDLFFQAKINETSKKLGVKVEFLKGDKDSVARITEAAEEAWPTLVVFDLNNLNAKPMTLIPKFKAKFKKATSIVGFLNHLQGDLKLKAIEAGCDTVMPRSAFSQSLPNLLRRYGLEEEEDNYPQPV